MWNSSFNYAIISLLPELSLPLGFDKLNIFVFMVPLILLIFFYGYFAFDIYLVETGDFPSGPRILFKDELYMGLLDLALFKSSFSFLSYFELQGSSA
jgi:hypothetical protein